MKKLILGLILICVFLIPLTTACCGESSSGNVISGKDWQESIADDGNSQNQEMTGEDEGQGETERERIQIQKAKDVQEAKQYQEELKEQLNELYKRGVEEKKRGMSEAVHMLQAMEGLKGLGPRVSELAQEFNNSMEKQIQHEERIQNRNWFRRFFLGGDKDAAGELEALTDADEPRIEELRQLKENCDSECQELLQEQIQNLEQERNRVRELAKQEKAKNGIFGWLFN